MTEGEKSPKRSPRNGVPVPSNPYGRPKGIPNKTTTQFKERLNDLLEYAAPRMVERLDEITDPKDYFEVLSKFVEYIHPKLARSEHTGANGGAIETKAVVEFVDKTNPNT